VTAGTGLSGIDVTRASIGGPDPGASLDSTGKERGLDSGRRTKVALFWNAGEGRRIKLRRCRTLPESATLVPKFRNWSLDKVDAWTKVARFLPCRRMCLAGTGLSCVTTCISWGHRQLRSHSVNGPLVVGLGTSYLSD